MQLKLMNAQQQTLLDRINERVGPNYSRMAGGSLALQLAPMAMSVLDNEETGLREAAAASLLSTGGSIAGAYIGRRMGSFANEETKQEFVRTAVDELKRQSKEIMAKEGVEAGNAYFAKGKEKLLQDIAPFYPEATIKKYPKLEKTTPRNMRSAAKGQLLGSLIAALPAYLATRGGTIEE